MVRHSDRRDRGRFAELIRDARRRRRWTQEQLADESGVSRSTLIRWESGESTRPERAQLHAAITALGVSADAAYDALGWVTDAELASANSGPPQAWVEAIRAIVALTDLDAGRRLERILELLDEYDEAVDAPQQRRRGS